MTERQFHFGFFAITDAEAQKTNLLKVFKHHDTATQTKQHPERCCWQWRLLMTFVHFCWRPTLVDMKSVLPECIGKATVISEPSDFDDKLDECFKREVQEFKAIGTSKNIQRLIRCGRTLKQSYGRCMWLQTE